LLVFSSVYLCQLRLHQNSRDRVPLTHHSKTSIPNLIREDNSCTSMRPPLSLPPISLLSPRTPLLNKSFPLIQCLRCFSATPIPSANVAGRRKQTTAPKLVEIPEAVGNIRPANTPLPLL